MPRVKKSPGSLPGSLPEHLADSPRSAEGERTTLFDASGDSRIRVYRRDDKMKLVMHGYLPPDSAEEDVARQFGGGHYKCQLIAKDSQGASVIVTSREFDLPGAYKPPAGELPGLTQRAPDALPSLTSVSPTLPGASNVMEILQSGLVGSVIDLLNKAKQPTPADTGLAEVLRDIAKQASDDRRMMLDMMKGLGQAAPSRAEVLAELEVMKRVLSAPSATSDSKQQLTELVEAIKQLRDVSEEFNPTRNDPTDPLSFVPQVLEFMTEEQKLRRSKATPPAVSLVPATKVPAMPMSSEPVPGPMKPESVPLWQRVLVGEGPKLVGYAQRGEDAEEVAALAIKFAPSLRGAFTEFFNRPADEALTLLVRHVPGLTDYPTWAEDFVLAAQYELFGEGDEPEPGTSDPAPAPSP